MEKSTQYPKLSLYGEIKISLKKYVDNFNRQWQAFLSDREAQRNLAKKVDRLN